MSTTRIFWFRQTILATALLAAFGPALAQRSAAEEAAMAAAADAIRRDLATPDSRVEAGIGVVSGESRRFGQFSGLNSDGAYGLLNLDLINRDDATGTWLKLKGSDLGNENRELRFEHERQGDWSYFLESRHLTRNEPWIVRTGLTGIGTTSETVSSTAPKRDINLKMEHESFALGARKFIIGGFTVRVSFKQDEKRGDRMYGRGATGTQEFLTEPLDRTTRQWEVVAGYVDKKLQLSGGYSGSSFEDRKQLLAVSPAGVTGITTLALPPSNDAHQLYLSGGYNIDDSTRTSFKFSHTLARQDSLFGIATSPGNASLDGRLVTTLAFADLSLRPMDRLSLIANVRLENRDDQTPTALYLPSQVFVPTAGVANALSTAGFTGYNVPRSQKQLKGMVEAGYELDDGYRLVGTLEQEQISRNVPVQYRRVAFRAKTDETLARIELKRSLSETLNGSVAYIRSDRGGSDYVDDTYTNIAAAPTHLINPLIWADRQRDKLRATADWIPEESWSVQFIGDLSADRYSGRTLGPRTGTGMFASGDATYALSEKWKFSGWVSQERTTANQTTHTDYNTAIPIADRGVLWEARIRNITSAWGLSLKGKPKAYLEVGAELSSSTDTAEHGMTRLGTVGGTGAAGYGTSSPTSLPAYFYRQLSLKLFADYAIERNSGLRATFTYDRRKTNDWTWAGYTYSAASDGTTVSQPNQQDTRFIGATYYYRWR
jgi:MtrB/PioB family decaheme-associated outer membrane protein